MTVRHRQTESNRQTMRQIGEYQLVMFGFDVLILFARYDFLERMHKYIVQNLLQTNSNQMFWFASSNWTDDVFWHVLNVVKTSYRWWTIYVFLPTHEDKGNVTQS